MCLNIRRIGAHVNRLSEIFFSLVITGTYGRHSPIWGLTGRGLPGKVDIMEHGEIIGCKYRYEGPATLNKGLR